MRVKVDVVVRATFPDSDTSEITLLETYRDYRDPGELMSNVPTLLATAGRLYGEKLAELDEDDADQPGGTS